MRRRFATCSTISYVTKRCSSPLSIVIFFMRNPISFMTNDTSRGVKDVASAISCSVASYFTSVLTPPPGMARLKYSAGLTGGSGESLEDVSEKFSSDSLRFFFGRRGTSNGLPILLYAPFESVSRPCKMESCCWKKRIKVLTQYDK